MRRTELLQEMRKLQFEEIYGNRQGPGHAEVRRGNRGRRLRAGRRFRHLIGKTAGRLKPKGQIMARFFHRMGDEGTVELSEQGIMADLVEVSEDTADRGKDSSLSKEEYDYPRDLFRSSHKFVSVEAGREVILSYDAATLKIRRVGVPDICIEMGMAGEFVLGMHSKLTYKRQRLAGCIPTATPYPSQHG